MRKLFILLAIIATHFAGAQDWTENLPVEKQDRADYSFYEIQKAFYDYWEPKSLDKGTYLDPQGTRTKAPGWKQFKRWEWYWENRINLRTGKFPESFSNSHRISYPKNKPANPDKSASWENIGTSSSTGGYAGIGRINCVAFHPTDPNTFWIGAPSGGLWLTNNNGVSWSVLTDNNEVLGVSDVAIPHDFPTSNTIYIATGDRDGGSAWSLGGGQFSDNNSIGVLKSTDGGATWNTTGLTFDVNQQITMSRLLIHPTDAQILYAATSAGVYKTVDAGANWTRYITDTFIDMEMKPDDPNTLLASTIQNANAPKIYRSIDAGLNWTEEHVFSTGERRVDIAWAPNDPNTIYSIVCLNERSLSGIYKSTNGGDSFSRVFNGTLANQNLLGYYSNGSGTAGQGAYDLCITVSPINNNEVYIGGVNGWKSTDGGTSWTIMNMWTSNPTYNMSGSPVVHADKHFLAFQDNTTLFECNDGGIYRSLNGGSTWTDLTNGLVISQLYRIGVSQSASNTVICGLQDNGTKLNNDGTWTDVLEGDGMECIIDPGNVNIQYGSLYYGSIQRTTNLWSSSTDISNNIPGGADGYWVTPYVIDPSDNNTLYVAYDVIWKSTNRGDSWSNIYSGPALGSFKSLAVASSNPLVIYAATSTSLMKTTDGGTSWTDITGTLASSTYSMTYIAVKHDDPNTLWVTFGGYDANRIFESTDGGTSWSNISTGLPDLPVMCIVEDKVGDFLYVGTDIGVFQKDITGGWVSFSDGLPNVMVTELEIYYNSDPSNNRLIAGTFGRGLWQTATTDPIDMGFDSGTSLQSDVSDVNPGSTDIPVLAVQLNTTGSLNPLNLTQLEINLNGTTDISGDIASANIYYTGSSSSFDNSDLFASFTPATGTITINQSQELVNGANYFWIAFDINSGATLDNYIDAECISFTMDHGVGTQTPDVSNPGSGRRIGVVYCTAGVTGSWEYISRVQIAEIDNVSGSTGYTDYTSQSATLPLASTETLSISISSVFASDQLKVWVDWNQDGDFDDIDELAYHSSEALSLYTADISPPFGTEPGTKRMRIRIYDFSSLTGGLPCGIEEWGEVEDYSLSVSDIPPGTVPLKEGWNISSLYLTPADPAMLSIVDPLIVEGSLEKIQDQFGDAIEPNIVTGGWINNIGDWENSEGYKIRTNANTYLFVSGTPIALPLTIDLNAGWNIISYPVDVPQTALDALNELIIANNLLKVQDETGAAIEPNPISGGWINNIVDFVPTEGYKIRVDLADDLTLGYPTKKTNLKKISTGIALAENFTTCWKGNGFDHMNIYIDQAASGLGMGDEIGIFDGELCVASGRVTDPELEILSLIASADDPATEAIDGFTTGNSIRMKIWNASFGEESIINYPAFLYGTKNHFEPMGSVYLAFKESLTDVEFSSSYSTGLGRIYPNPFKEAVNIEFSLKQDTRVEFEVYNILGEKIDQIEGTSFNAGIHTLTWLKNVNQKDGVYIIKMTTAESTYTKSVLTSE